MERRVKVLSYRSFPARDRLWRVAGSLFNPGQEQDRGTSVAGVVDWFGGATVDIFISLLKSMNTIKEGLDQSVEFGIALHALAHGVDGVHDGGMMHGEGSPNVGKRL